MRTDAESGAARASQASRAAEPAGAWTPEIEDLLEQWHRRAWAAQLGHYRVAGRVRKHNVALGVPVVVLSAIVGTSLFATLSQATLPLPLRIAIGTISVVAAVLAAVQNFFGFGQLAEKHVLAADWYAAIRRRIELLQALPAEARGDAVKMMDAIRKEMNTVGSQFPELPSEVWEQMTRRLGLKERASPPGDVDVDLTRAAQDRSPRAAQGRSSPTR